MYNPFVTFSFVSAGASTQVLRGGWVSVQAASLMGEDFGLRDLGPQVCDLGQITLSLQATTFPPENGE